MNFRNIIRYSLILFIVALLGCDRENEQSLTLEQYYPLDLGNTKIYDVTEVTYTSGIETPAIASYQEREQLTRATTNEDGFPLYVFTRSVRDTGSTQWEFKEEFTVEELPSMLLLTERNEKFVSFVLPVTTSYTWDYNLYNTRGEEVVSYESVNSPDSSNGGIYPNTTTISLLDSTLIDLSKRTYSYAAGVGLYYEELVDYAYCQSSEECIGLGIIESGNRRVRRLQMTQ